MKPGTEMDYKQGQTTVVIAEKDQGSIYRPCAEVWISIYFILFINLFYETVTR